MLNTETRYAGTLEILSGKMLVTDPCYIPDALDGASLELEVPKGAFKVTTEVSDEGNWGSRIASLTITFAPGLGYTERTLGRVFVDSGQMSFLDAQDTFKFGSHDISTFEPEKAKGAFSYEGICNETLSEKQCGAIAFRMVASSTGFGDGAYEVIGNFNGDTLLSVTVHFIQEEEEDEWGWDDDEDEDLEDEDELS